MAVFGLILIGCLAIFSLVKIKNNQELKTAIVTPQETDFKISLEDSYQLKEGDGLSVMISILGATSTVGKGIIGIAMTLEGVPSFLSNPRLQINNSSWKIQSNTVGNDVIFTAMPDDLGGAAITSDQTNFAQIVFDVVSAPGTSTMTLKTELSDNKIPSNSHVIPDTKIKISPYYSIYGTISGDATSGVELSYGNYTATSGTGGEFEISDIPGNTTGTLTPSLSGYTFAPATRTINITNSSIDDQDFVATKEISSHSISGTISGDTKSGVQLTCGSYTATSESNGAFTIANVPDGTTCTLTPSLSSYTFSPTTRSVTVTGADVTGQDFIATQPTSSCGAKNQDISEPIDTFNSSDFNDYERIYLGMKNGMKRDVNSDGTLNYTDVVSLFQCLLCQGDWDGCSI